MAKLRERAKCNVASYDYPGYGFLYPDKRRSFAANAKVALEAFYAMLERAPDGAQVILVGYSLGGCPTMYLAREMATRIHAIVLIDPITSLARRVAKKYTNLSKLLWSSCNTLAALATTAITTTVIQGDMMGKTTWPENVRVVGSIDSPHMYLLENEETRKEVVRVLDEMGKLPRNA